MMRTRTSHLTRWILRQVFQGRTFVLVFLSLSVVYIRMFLSFEDEKQETAIGLKAVVFRKHAEVLPVLSFPLKTKMRYHSQLLGVRGGAVVQHPVLDSFRTNLDKCHNCLPNYFLKSTLEQRPRYTNGTSVYVHHHKAGGTTMTGCLVTLLGKPERLGGDKDGRLAANILLPNVHIDIRLLWMHTLSESERLGYKYIGGANVMGICDDINVIIRPCSYYIVLRDPIERAVSAYFYCKIKTTDELCATRKLDARTSDVKQWVIHQRSFLLTHLLFDIRYCNMSYRYQQPLPCWYRQRMLMEETDLDPVLQFVLDDLINRFAVIGMLDDFETTLAMFQEVYGLNFVKCIGHQANSLEKVISRNSAGKVVPKPNARKRAYNSTLQKLIISEVEQQVQNRDELVASLREDPDVTHALRYDLTIYKRAVEIFLRQKQALTNA